MSTEYEPKAILGYSFSHNAFVNIVKEKFPELYEELDFEKEYSYHAMLAESFADSFDNNLYALYIEDSEEHIIGLELENYQNSSDVILFISEHSDNIKSLLKMENEPKIIFDIFKY
tara:strand:- start:1498 stop:1845 length:348 start_codon:yes stop_codon:yes gene_type:complete